MAKRRIEIDEDEWEQGESEHRELQACVKELEAEVAEWKRVASEQAEMHSKDESKSWKRILLSETRNEELEAELSEAQKLLGRRLDGVAKLYGYEKVKELEAEVEKMREAGLTYRKQYEQEKAEVDCLKLANDIMSGRDQLAEKIISEYEQEKAQGPMPGLTDWEKEAVRMLREISNFREAAWEYDDDMGHEKRSFIDEEEWERVEGMAKQTLESLTPELARRQVLGKDEQKEPDRCPECGSDNPLIRKCPSCRGYTEGGCCVPCTNAWHDTKKEG